MDKVYDADPLTLYEAGACAQHLLDTVNQLEGINLELHEVLSITDEAIRQNKTGDLASMRLFRDIESGSPELTIKGSDKPDFRPMENGEEGYWVSGRGVVVLAFIAWKKDHLPRGQQFMEKYCQLAARRDGIGAKQIMQRLQEMSLETGIQWIKHTYPMYVHNDWEPIEIMNAIAASKN